MPRISEPDIERVKRDTDLLALIQSRGVRLSRKGKNWTGLCPFHEDNSTPNLIVTAGKGLWRCMACNAAGNAIQFLQKHDGLSFRHAFELLSNGGKAAFESNGRHGPAKSSTVRNCPAPSARTRRAKPSFPKSRPTITEAFPQPARPGLPQNPRPRRRRTLQAVPCRLRRPHPRPAHPPRQQEGGRDHPLPPERAGVFRPNGREHLHGCLVVPVTDMEGNTLQLYGRRVDPSAPRDGRHLYLPRPLAGVFNPEAFASRDLILCESVLDAMTFCRHGMDSATCAFGTGGMNEDLGEALKARKTETVRIAYDSDKAGEKGFRKGRGNPDETRPRSPPRQAPLGERPQQLRPRPGRRGPQKSRPQRRLE